MLEFNEERSNKLLNAGIFVKNIFICPYILNTERISANYKL